MMIASIKKSTGNNLSLFFLPILMLNVSQNLECSPKETWQMPSSQIKWKDQFIYCRMLYKLVILTAFSCKPLSMSSTLKWKWTTESPKLKMDPCTYFPRQPPAMEYLIILLPPFIAIDATEHYLKTTDQCYHNLKFYLLLSAFENPFDHQVSWLLFKKSLFRPWKFHDTFWEKIP